MYYEDLIKSKKSPTVFYNLIICYFALNDKRKIITSLMELVKIVSEN